MTSEENLKRMLGEPKKAIRTMAISFFVAFAVVEVNQFVDTFWVSGLGVTSASAVATVAPIYGLMMCLGLGISAGATTTIAFRLGSGEKDVAGKLASNAIIMGIIVAIIASIVFALSLDLLIDLMGANDVHDEAVSYMIPYFVMSPSVMLVTIVGGLLRGEGAAKRSTYIQALSAIFNMAIDPILIYVLGLGVFGAGLSTTVSATIALLFALAWYIRGTTVVSMNRSNFRWDKGAAREIIGVGGPKAVQLTISNLTDLLQRVFLIIAGGTTAVMLYNYTWRYIGIASLPGRAVETAQLPVTSAAFGQSDLDKVEEAFRYSVKMGLIISMLAAVVLFVFAEPFMSLMTIEESMSEHLAKLVWTLRVSVFIMPFLCVAGSCSSLLQAIKKAKIPMYVYMVWGVLKLSMYAVACYGLLGVDPFDGIIYCMVIVHVILFLAMWILARREFNKLKRASVSV